MQCLFLTRRAISNFFFPFFCHKFRRSCFIHFSFHPYAGKTPSVEKPAIRKVFLDPLGTTNWMYKWPAQEIRETFLQFFEGKKHLRLPSFSLIPSNDPTLLFTAAGMAPFKAEFAGLVEPPQTRITTCQRCLRADDLEKVGYTSRHHTFFEMLGNFSFGDYFKEEAIVWAWELLTEFYRLPEERLWISVHPTDQEAYSIWNKKIGLPSNRIILRKDNFWGPIGKTGTCGPDSEIHWDQGAASGFPDHDCRPGCEAKDSSGKECERFLELWNLVFTMYYKEESGNLRELSRKNIDTGAGLERFAMILQEKPSPYETDLFLPIINAIHPQYFTASEKEKTAARIVADHIRAATYLMADGVFPSNEGRGYVLRRILRRALIYQQRIPKAPPLHSLISSLVSCAPEEVNLTSLQAQIKQQIKEETENFAGTLRSGLAWLEEEMLLKKKEAVKVISGNFLFRLHDERGFPFELAREFLQEKGYQADEKGFYQEMEKQQTRSRRTRQGVDVLSQASETNLFPPTEFLGYEVTQAKVQVLALLQKGKPVEILREKEEGILVLDKTPFYAESGGQVGDTGVFQASHCMAKVLDTQKDERGVFFHKIRVETGELQAGTGGLAAVDSERRKEIRKHHSATHLLLAGLRATLGTHVQQEGSYVCDDYLRLDFSHPNRVSSEELSKIEAMINSKTLENFQVQTEITTPQEAKKQGALSFFGEKYGNQVRMVTMNEFSKELCGGTHVRFTGEIGSFFIIKESAIAKGIRRIEAKAGKAAVFHLLKLQDLRTYLMARLQVEFQDLIPQMEFLLEQKQKEEKESKRLRRELAFLKALSLLEKVKKTDSVSFLIAEVLDQGKEELRAMVDALKTKGKLGIIFLASFQKEKVFLICRVSPELVERGFSALKFISAVSPLVKGEGGGRIDLAEAGGKDPARLEEALVEVEKLIRIKVQKPAT